MRCWSSLASSVTSVGSVKVGASCARDCGSPCAFITGKVVGKRKSNNWSRGFIANCFATSTNNVLSIFCSVVEEVRRLFDCAGWATCINCANRAIASGFMPASLSADNSACLDSGDKLCVEGVSCINRYRRLLQLYEYNGLVNRMRSNQTYTSSRQFNAVNPSED